MKKTMKKIIAFVLTVTTMMIFNVFADTTTQTETGEVSAPQNSTSYTGAAVTPDIALQDAGVTLVNGTDYDLEYQNNIEVGTATIIVKFKGNYEGERSVNFEIVARTLSNQDVSFASIDTQMYTGEAITPEPAIMYNGVTLEKDKDYTLSYADNVNVGTASINVTFMGNYTGSATTTFEIARTTLSSENVSFAEIAGQTYTGKAITPEPTITYNGVTLEKDKDYTLAYKDNVNVGTATIEVTFIGSYEGTATTTFAIKAKAVTEENITISTIADQIYTGKEIKPEPTVTDVTR